MSKHTINIQDGYLFQTLKEERRLTVELINGKSYAGLLRRFDRFALILDTEGREVLIYKHAISTIEVEGGRG